MNGYWNDHKVIRIDRYVTRRGVRSAWVKVLGVSNLVLVTLRDIRVGP